MSNNMECDRDTGLMAVCAIRYCIGRMTYMPSTIVGWVKRHWASLPEGDRACMLRDLEAEFKNEPLRLGMDCDIKTWRSFYEWMRSQV